MKSVTILPVSAIWDFSQIDSIMNKSLLRLAFQLFTTKQNMSLMGKKIINKTPITLAFV